MMNWFEKENKESDGRSVQIKGEIQSLNIRKDTALSVYQKDMQGIENTKESIINQIGTLVYSKYLSQDNICLDDFKEFWDRLDQLAQDAETSTQKKDEIVARYDEEIGMLSKELNYLGEENVIGDRVCCKCGAKIGKEDIFCEYCGAKQV